MRAILWLLAGLLVSGGAMAAGPVQTTLGAAQANPAGIRGALGLSAQPPTQRAPLPSDDISTGIVAGAVNTNAGSYWRTERDNQLYQATANTLGGAAWSPVTMQGIALPGDAASVAPLVAYSGCQVVKAYAGPTLRVQRNSDSTQTDLGFVTGGFFDWDGFAAFCKGTECRIAKRYDQKGGGANGDQTQATYASMPLITPFHRFGRCPALVADSYPPATNNYRNLVTPTAVALTKNALSAVAMVRVPNGVISYAPMMQIGTGSDAIQIINFPPYGPSITFNGGGGAASTGYGATSAEVLSLTSGSGGVAMKYGQAAAASFSAFGAVSLTGGLTGSPSAGVASHAVATAAPIEEGALLQWSSALSAADVASETAAMHARFETAPQVQDLVFMDGESNAQGYGTTTFFAFARQLSDRLYGTARFVNNAAGGQTVATMLTNYPTYSAIQYNANRRNNVYVLFPGANDIWSSGNTAAQEMANISSIVSAAKATGFTVVVATEVDRTGTAGQVTAKDALTVLIRSGAAAGGYTVADVAANALIGADGASANTTYFSGDGAHMAVPGHTIAAGIIETTVRSVLK